MTIRVLFVDDEKELLEAACDYAHIEFAGKVKLITAYSSQSALELIKDDGIEAIISDYKMDFMDGLELLEVVRNQDQKIPFIIFTRHSREEIAIKALNLGATFYLKKDAAHIKAQFHELCNLVIHAVEKTKAEEKIAELRKMIKLIEEVNINLDNGDAPSVTLNKKGEIININKAMCNLLKCEKEKVLNTDWFKFIPKDRKKEVKAVFDEIITEKVKTPWYTNPVIDCDGNEYILRWHNTVIRNNGTVVGTFSSGEDITGKMDEEDILREQRDELSFFARTVSHDLHNKLATMAMYNSLNPNPSEHSKKIGSAVIDMTEYLDNLHYLARIGEKHTHEDTINLDEIIKKVKDDFAPFVKDIKFLFHPLPKIKGHYTNIEQIFHNLIINVINHADATKLIIWCKRNTTSLKIFIRDNGKGIAPIYQQRIRALWNKHKFQDVSHGLGLLIVKKVIEDHDGIVEFSSGYKNGTTFRLSLPLERVL